MKICDLTQAYTHSSGGVKTYIHEKQRYVQRYTGHQHVLIVPGESDTCDCDGQCTVYTVKGQMLPKCDPYRFIFRLDKVYKILEKEKPDIIELGSAYILPYPSILASKKHKSKLIGFYHADFPEAYIEKFFLNFSPPIFARSLGKAARYYARFIYNMFHNTVVTTNFMKDVLIGSGIKNIEQIPLGVDLEIFNPNKRDSSFREHFGIGKDDILLVYSGRFDYEKRIEVLLKAFSIIESGFPGKLVLIGQGPHLNLVKDYSSRSKKIHVMPYENNREMLAKMLASSDIYVTAGPHETFGLSIIEAQACGLPVVGVKSGALVDRVNQERGLLGKPDSEIEMAANILEIIKKDFRGMGRSAYNHVLQEFSWKKTFDRLFTLYGTLTKTYTAKNRQDTVQADVRADSVRSCS